MTSGAKKRLKTALKVCVSLGALAFVFTRIDLQATWQTLKAVNVAWLAAALFVYIASQLVSSERLRLMLRPLGIRLQRWVCVKLYWLGMFYNFFLPGGVGGDGYKVYWLHKRHPASVRRLVMCLLGDRLSGLAAILVYTVLYAAFRTGLLGAHANEYPDQHYLLLLLPVGAWLYWLFFKLFAYRLRWTAFWAAAVSLLVQGLQMAAAAAILTGLGVERQMGDYLFLFLLSSVASAVPITVGGVGAREVAFMIGSAHLGTDQTTAIALSLLFYAVSLASALPGLYAAINTNLIDGRRMPKPETTPDLTDVIDQAAEEAGKKEQGTGNIL